WLIPSVRSSLSVTAVSECAVPWPSWWSTAVESPRFTRYSWAPSRNSRSTSTPARPFAPSRRIESLSPRTACTPYSAQAIASRIDVLPEPFGPMIPVIPGPNSSPASACWRKVTRRDLGSAQIELEVERAGLVGADGAMIQVPGGGPGHVEHELPHDLIVDPGLRAGDGAGDLLVQLLRRESLALDGRELDVTPHGWNR